MRIRSWQAWTLLIALALAMVAEAKGKRKPSSLSAEASLSTTGGAESIVFSGRFEGLEKKKYKAVVTLRSALSNKVLDQQDCAATGGRFEGRFGPYEKPFWPQTYVVTVNAMSAPGGDSATGMGTAAARIDEAPPPLEKRVLVQVHTTKTVEEQRETQANRFRDALLVLRTLFLEVERRVPDLKAKYATDMAGTTREFEAWWKSWGERITSLAASFADRSYLDYWGNPFVQEYDALSTAVDQVAKYGQRAIVNISGEEKLDPSDRGKDFDQLERAGKLPSSLLRERFLYGLALAYETSELPNPNGALADAAIRGVADAFLALFHAFHGGGMDAKGPEMMKYAEFKGKATNLLAELALFYERRRSILPGERQIQQQVQLLEAYLAKLSDLEQKYKDGATPPAESARAEMALVKELSHGTLLLARPSLQEAFDTMWGVYQTVIQYPDGMADYGGIDPPDPQFVKEGFDAAMQRADAYLKDARRFLGEVESSAPGVESLMEVVRKATQVSDDLARLLKLCEEVDDCEDEKRRKEQGDTAVLRAQDIAKRLEELRGAIDKAFAPVK